MKKSVTVRVPATSANCGPGFDSLGLALTLYNEFTFRISDEVFGFSLDVEGEGKDCFYASGRNMAFSSFLAVWNRLTDHKRIGIAIHMKNQVPKSRGLGSSSTAIVAGVTAASILSGANLSQDEILQEANRLEGHPDNVAPAIYGGFTISFQEDGVAHTLRTVPKMPLQFIAVVPDMQLSTHLARAAIPKEIAHPDAVFNASRTALLTAALLENRPELLQYALEDKLHQPYRAKLIPGFHEVFAAGKATGAYQCIISGSGSTLLAYASPEKDGDVIGKAMVDAFASCGQTAVYHILQLNTKGTEVLNIEI
ncbi:MAG TPA: homoserine kinase [Acidaminococcaceae bacterium]|nr:homoserine kinase [Acidaminococcaceae bacterium]